MERIGFNMSLIRNIKQDVQEATGNSSSTIHYEPWKSKWLIISRQATNKNVIFK